MSPEVSAEICKGLAKLGTRKIKMEFWFTLFFSSVLEHNVANLIYFILSNYEFLDADFPDRLWWDVICKYCDLQINWNKQLQYLSSIYLLRLIILIITAILSYFILIIHNLVVKRCKSGYKVASENITANETDIIKIKQIGINQ